MYIFGCFVYLYCIQLDGLMFVPIGNTDFRIFVFWKNVNINSYEQLLFYSNFKRYTVTLLDSTSILASNCIQHGNSEWHDCHASECVSFQYVSYSNDVLVFVGLLLHVGPAYFTTEPKVAERQSCIRGRLRKCAELAEEKWRSPIGNRVNAVDSVHARNWPKVGFVRNRQYSARFVSDSCIYGKFCPWIKPNTRLCLMA